jgi:hypothetical protein
MDAPRRPRSALTQIKAMRALAGKRSFARSRRKGRNMFIPFTAMLLGSQLVVAVADEVPRFNIDATCRTDEGAGGGPSLAGAGGCKRDEQDAHDRLAKMWAQFNAGDRADCTQTSMIGGAGSYVELLTCLQLRSDARKLPDSK